MRAFRLSVALAAIGIVVTGVTPAPRIPASATVGPTLSVRVSAYGRILFDGRGRALYAFTRDRRNRTTCFGPCLSAWPAYTVRGALRPGSGVERAKLGTLRRLDGRRHVTYAGKPLYYYVGDRRPGQVLCQNVREFGGLWLVVRPDGSLVR
jgi:predicted lipoprotein with Yx(FWY)xxD motif